MKRICLALLIAGILSAWTAADIPVVFAMYGQGSVSCSVWTSNRRASTLLAMEYESWVLGYATAAGRYRKEASPSRITGTMGIVEAVSNYCLTHPSSMLMGATEDAISSREPKD